MATARRNGTAPLIDALFDRPGRFDFFQAVRLLELAASADGSFRPVGEDHPPDRECVRFRTSPSLAFAASEVRQLSRPAGPGSAAELVVSFLGFVGSAGVLPQHYSETLVERLQQRDTTLRDWMDLFHHRVLSLFYRAWLKYRFPFGYERAARELGGEDAFTRVLLSLAGRGQSALRGRLPVDDTIAAFEAGHMARRTRSAHGLALTLSDVFGVPVRVEEFAGRWLEIPDDERCVLRSHAAAGDVRVRLGGGAVLGARVWDLTSKVRIVVGPVTFATFEHLRPGENGADDALSAMARDYLGVEFDFDVRFELDAGQSPGTCIGSREGTPRARLGHNSWLESGQRAPGRRSAYVCRGHPREFAG